ncbi:methyltransferase [Candidatus Woesearchaeota archaeon]|nr:methyltransferase [Candidatus Woesearchaeota archaeon]
MTYEPQEDSYLLLEYVKQLAYGKVLDMGTGSGILAKGASYKNDVEEVIAVDIDEQCIEELKKKDIAGVKAFQSNLFGNITEKFDTIVFNPPYLPIEEKDKDVALDGGVKGYEVIEMFLKQAKKHLNPGGIILMVFSNRTGKEQVDKVIEKENYMSELLEKKSLPLLEELYVYKIKII